MYTPQTLLVTALAAAAIAAPTTNPATRTPPFTIRLRDPLASSANTLYLHAEPISSAPSEIALIFRQPAFGPPTPAYLHGTATQLNSTTGYGYLNFVNPDTAQNPNCEDFGVYLPNIGDGPGFDEPVNAELGLGSPSFKVVDGGLFGEVRAAPNTFAACNGTVNEVDGLPSLALHWVNMETNGTWPEGCRAVQLEVLTEG